VTLHEQYRSLHDGAGIGSIAPRYPLIVKGADRASFLHGLLSNEVRTLKAGGGCYAAWLTAQGRMLTDVHLLEMGDGMLLDVPAELASQTLERLDQSLFSEDVQINDAGKSIAPLWIHGPAAASVLEAVLQRPGALDNWQEYQHDAWQYRDGMVRVARISQLGVPGFCAYVAPDAMSALVDALSHQGAVRVEPPAIEALRVEWGYPVFGVDMTTDTIPLEAGIEDRAISFTKGCYVGQEVIVRMVHRGGGRVARRLMGLRFSAQIHASGTRLFSTDRDAGWVTSVAVSPTRGIIGLGYVQRDVAVEGTQLAVGGLGAAETAVVTERPMTRDR
jgi:folate-binding protein YgfZ